MRVCVGDGESWARLESDMGFHRVCIRLRRLYYRYYMYHGKVLRIRFNSSPMFSITNAARFDKEALALGWFGKV